MERDFGVQVALIGMNYFNSHAHVERDPSHLRRVFEPQDFNSHAHVERDSDWIEQDAIN